MEHEAAACAICGDPIERDQASMKRDDGAVAHSGCVYSDVENVEQRDRWMPADAESARSVSRAEPRRR